MPANAVTRDGTGSGNVVGSLVVCDGGNPAGQGRRASR